MLLRTMPILPLLDGMFYKCLLSPSGLMHYIMSMGPY